jgi:hypothetical protein
MLILRERFCGILKTGMSKRWGIELWLPPFLLKRALLYVRNLYSWVMVAVELTVKYVVSVYSLQFHKLREHMHYTDL